MCVFCKQRSQHPLIHFLHLDVHEVQTTVLLMFTCELHCRVKTVQDMEEPIIFFFFIQINKGVIYKTAIQSRSYSNGYASFTITDENIR